jgi:ATP-dependent exoDNAse (exonuclease V) alpha subunit
MRRPWAFIFRECLRSISSSLEGFRKAQMLFEQAIQRDPSLALAYVCWGDIGIVERIDPLEHEVTIRFDERLVKYDFGELDEVAPAYAITIHKSQGSEFPAVVIPLATQHYMLLQRNLIYTGITRGKRLLVPIGQKKALGIAVRNDRPQRRYSGLLSSLRSDGQGWVVS